MKSLTENLSLGVMELFAVLLPGAVACIVLGQWPGLKDAFLDLMPSSTSEWQGGIAFFISAYFMGYVVYAIGSKLDKWVDERWIIPNKSDLVYRVIPLKVREIGFDDPMGLNNYQWALARLMMDQPELYAEVERYQATAKFFRSMVVVATAAVIVFGLTGRINLVLGATVVLVLSFYLYYERRKKSLEIAYKRVITMLGSPSQYPEAVEDLVGLNVQIGMAEYKKDYEFLNAVLADNLVFLRASGKVVDKRTFLRDLPDNNIEEIRSDVEAPILSGDARAAFVVVHVTVQRTGVPGPRLYRNERLFHLDVSGHWKLVGWVNKEETI